MQTKLEWLRTHVGGQGRTAHRREPRTRDYLTREEVGRLLGAAKKGPRHRVRNYAMILLAYRHGLRASEVVGLQRSDLDLRAHAIYCRRVKGGRQSVHPMKSDEVVAVERALRERKWQSSEYVFGSDRSEKMTRSAFWRVVSQAGKRAGLPFKVYSHQLRHGCGYYLCNKGCELRLVQEYLGHNYVNNTVRYTRLNPARFEGLW
jgi:site-specific recombinase XerD